MRSGTPIWPSSSRPTTVEWPATSWATPDTDAFEEWFRDEWWPQFADRWPRPGEERSRQDGILRYAYGRRPGREPYADGYPAHLHIDLLPELQGQGWGRRLIDTLDRRAARAGCPGTASRGILRQHRCPRVLSEGGIRASPVARRGPGFRPGTVTVHPPVVYADRRGSRQPRPPIPFARVACEDGRPLRTDRP